MIRYIKYITIFLIGVGVAYFIFGNQKKQNVAEASSTIAYGIQRLNKLVVAEQNYANFYSHKSSNSYLGNLISFDKNLLLKVDLRVQASYDLSAMKIEMDSINQKIIINEIPDLKLETFPDVDFFEMKQSKLNQFSKEELNAIKKRAILAVEKKIDYTELRRQAQEQLFENLEEIYLLAKIYGWEVENNTKFSKPLENRIKF